MNLQDLSVSGKKVLMRVDFNVPLTPQGQVADDSRLRASLPSIRTLLDQGASIILMSHLGRPKGKKDPAFSLKPCAEALSKLLGMPVKMAPDCIGPEVETLAHALKPKEILLLENLRFYPAEEKPALDPLFAKQLSELADLYVDDAFGAAHRNHSSITTITEFFKGKKAKGLLLQKEISFLDTLIKTPKHPFFALIGGAKISSKLPILRALLNTVDGLFIGGAMAHTLLKAQGIAMGDSLVEEDQLEAAKEFLTVCKKPLYLPLDLKIAEQITETSPTRIVSIQQGVPAGWKSGDIGPATIKEWEKVLPTGATLFWNGPLGVFECPPFAEGTHAIAKLLAQLPAITVVGGGDSLAAIASLHLEEHFTHLSTGGGASLEYIENAGHLPGIDVLQD